MRLGPLHHIGTVVPSLDEARRVFVERLGGAPVHDTVELADTARLGFVQMPGVLMELIEPLSAIGDLADFLAAHPGGGQHHVCHEVGDIHVAWAECEAAGAEFICPIVTGVLGHPIFFVRMPDLPGLLVELIQLPSGSGAA